MRNVRVLTAFCLILMGATFAHATPQIPDVLIYEGKEYPIYNADLLQDYFAKFPDRNPKKDEGRNWCSGLWKGYHAVYEASGDRIYLKDILTGVCFGPGVSALRKAIPDSKRLATDWYSGLLLSFYGQHDDKGSNSPYSLELYDAFEKYSLFEVSNGQIVQVHHFSNKTWREFRKRQFQAFQKTSEYKDEYKRQVASGEYDKALIDKNIEFFFLWNAKELPVK